MPLALCTQGQVLPGIEDVIVERYHVKVPQGTGEDSLVTYRIYVDLAPDHVLQMVYGDARHPLSIRTTTEFWNDTLQGEKYGSRIRSGSLNGWDLALDSWLTIKSASDAHWGVPLALDPDGSVLSKPIGRLELADNASSDRSDTLGEPKYVDGLIPAPEQREVVNFHFEPGYLGKISGGIIHTMDGAWGVLGGAYGVTDENLVLIAQLRTTGKLSFDLNMQVKEHPDGRPVRYVHSDPREGEVLLPALHYQSAP